MAARFGLVGALAPVLLSWIALAPPGSAAAQSSAAPVGPCSPIAAADGDIPSEMPGCRHRIRALPGSLDDELAFRRKAARHAAPEAPDQRQRRGGRPQVDDDSEPPD